MNTGVVTSLLPVLLLSLAVSSAPAPAAPAAAAYYYEPIVPYGPYPAHGYVVSTYIPKYRGYSVVNPVRYDPRKPEYEQEEYEEEEPKYYYGGKFKGVCSVDGLYYMDDKSYVVCSNGFASHQPCPLGTKTDKFPSYKPGYYYGAADLCSLNLVDYGYAPTSYVPPRDKKPPHSYEEKPVTSYGSGEPQKDPYKPPVPSYDPPKDPYPTTYQQPHESYPPQPPSYPPQTSYQPSGYSSQDGYAVDQPSSYSSESYHDVSYPPQQDTYHSPTDYVHSPDPSYYKPSPPAPDSYPPQDPYPADPYYKPSSSYVAPPARPSDYKREKSAKDSH